VEVTPLPYGAAERVPDDLQGQTCSATHPLDLVLGPTESAALKALNDSLETQQLIPFLAPFITTSPKTYRNLVLIPGAPGDEERVRTAHGIRAARCFPNPRILHSDDVWVTALSNASVRTWARSKCRALATGRRIYRRE